MLERQPRIDERFLPLEGRKARRWSLDMAENAPKASVLAVGLTARCPRCGKGALFKSGLVLRDKCSNCGLSYAFADSGDGRADVDA